jgi:NADH-quinone oxidoreductase subunit E
MSRIQEEISIQGRAKDELLELLKEVQSKFGYLSGEALVEIAESLDLPVSEVYGMATFYSFLSTKPQGRNVIRICKSVPCFLKNSDIIIESIKKELGIKPGETTPDGRFSFELTNCIGACDKAPAMMLNHDVYGDLTPEKISQILREYE